MKRKLATLVIVLAGLQAMSALASLRPRACSFIEYYQNSGRSNTDLSAWERVVYSLMLTSTTNVRQSS